MPSCTPRYCKPLPNRSCCDLGYNPLEAVKTKLSLKATDKAELKSKKKIKPQQKDSKLDHSLEVRTFCATFYKPFYKPVFQCLHTVFKNCLLNIPVLFLL